MALLPLGLLLGLNSISLLGPTAHSRNLLHPRDASKLSDPSMPLSSVPCPFSDWDAPCSPPLLFRSCSRLPFRPFFSSRPFYLLDLPFAQSQILLCPLTCLLFDSAFHEAASSPLYDPAALISAVHFSDLSNSACPQPQCCPVFSLRFPLLSTSSLALLSCLIHLLPLSLTCFPFSSSLLETCFQPHLSLSPLLSILALLRLALYHTKSLITSPTHRPLSFPFHCIS